MALTRIEGPSEWPVSLDEAKRFCRVEHDDDDLQLEGFILAATAHLDGRDGLLGRALLPQSWRATFAMFPSAIELPLPPLISVETVTYVDTAGVTQTLASSAYQVAGIGAAEGGCIRPAYGHAWPSTRPILEAVAVYFTAGFSADPAELPDALRQAVLMHVAHLYANREAAQPDTMRSVPYGYDDLIAPFRVWAFA